MIDDVKAIKNSMTIARKLQNQFFLTSWREDVTESKMIKTLGELEFLPLRAKNGFTISLIFFLMT